MKILFLSLLTLFVLKGEAQQIKFGIIPGITKGFFNNYNHNFDIKLYGLKSGASPTIGGYVQRSFGQYYLSGEIHFASHNIVFKHVIENTDFSYSLQFNEKISQLQFFSYAFIPLSVGMFPHLFQNFLTARSAKTFRLTVIAHPVFIMIVWMPCILIGIWAAGDCVQTVHRVYGLVAVPAFEVEVVDTTGCGDAFSAGFLRGLAAGKDLEAAGVLGSATAALVAQGMTTDHGEFDLVTVEKFAAEATGR